MVNMNESGAMSFRDRKLKSELLKNLRNTSHLKFAERLEKFDIRIVPFDDDPDCTAYVKWGEGAIYIGEGFLDIPDKSKFEILSQLNVLIRHEMSHKIFMHFIRMAKEVGINLSKSPSFHDILNYIEDDEISNRTYTDDDKNIVRNMTQIRLQRDPLTGELKKAAEVIGGLVTEDHRANWLNLPVEKMYENLKGEIRELNKSLIAYRDNNSDKTAEAELNKAFQDPLLSRAINAGKPYQSLKRQPSIFYTDMSPDGVSKDADFLILPAKYKDVTLACAKYLYSFPESERVDKAKELVKTIADTSIVDEIKIGDIVLDTPEKKQIATDYFKCAYFPAPEDKKGKGKGNQPSPQYSPEYIKDYTDAIKQFDAEDSGGNDVFSEEELGEIVTGLTKGI